MLLAQAQAYKALTGAVILKAVMAIPPEGSRWNWPRFPGWWQSSGLAFKGKVQVEGGSCCQERVSAEFTLSEGQPFLLSHSPPSAA